MLDILTRITEGNGKPEDLDTLQYLGEQIKATSLCALGGTAPNPVLTTLKYFRDEYEAHINEKRCPAGACQNLLRYTIAPEKCIGCTKCARNCPVNCISGKVKEPHLIDRKNASSAAPAWPTAPSALFPKVKQEGDDLKMDAIQAIINGKEISAEPGMTILQAAKANGIHIPTLCDHPAVSPFGACRICLVEAEKNPKLLPACTTPLTPGMVVFTNTRRLSRPGKRCSSSFLYAIPWTASPARATESANCRTWPMNLASRNPVTPTPATRNTPMSMRMPTPST
jgi:NAD-dependent dihydropyrimidine dehydrogenase PreA subunit/ferredoxin